MKKKMIKSIALFLLFVAVYGAFISLANHLLREYGYNSKYTSAILIGSMVYVYYKAWRRFCRNLDSM